MSNDMKKFASQPTIQQQNPSKLDRNLTSKMPDRVYRPLKKYYTYPLPSRILENESEDESEFTEEEEIIEVQKPTSVIQDTLSCFTAAMGFSCSLFLFIWSCVLSNYSRK